MSRKKNLTRQQQKILREIFDRHELMALTCSDREILTFFNGQLANNKAIPVDAFIQYRSGNREPEFAKYETIFENIGTQIDVMHVHQKMKLVDRIKEEGSHWQKWKWLIELRGEKATDNTNMTQNIDWSNYKLGLNFT